MDLKTVKKKVAHIILVLLLASMLFGPVTAGPAFAGDCPDNGSISC